MLAVSALYHPSLGFSSYEDVELLVLDVEEPEEIQIRKILPAIAEHLSILHQGLAQGVDNWGAEIRERLNSIELRLGDLLEGCIFLTLHPTRCTTAASGSTTPASAATAAGSFYSALASLSSAAAPSLLLSPPPQQQQQQQQQQQPPPLCGRSGQ
ncbi:hypothetical protein K469DRAFT_697457 [Zopfia rhizophila CBS 207.26]|uniref:Uncharacterized protein n=1 Tax=Zopfia rhizophila CBS 207.26 TaxID=1314779 RepID=A0A6A6DGR2_9PEZI|nr:hypothetical protein K469DRAFT_697457 [Zopfia rhizophila CBS 207.26]